MTTAARGNRSYGVAEAVACMDWLHFWEEKLLGIERTMTVMARMSI